MANADFGHRTATTDGLSTQGIHIPRGTTATPVSGTDHPIETPGTRHPDTPPCERTGAAPVIQHPWAPAGIGQARATETLRWAMLGAAGLDLTPGATAEIGGLKIDIAFPPASHADAIVLTSDQQQADAARHGRGTPSGLAIYNTGGTDMAATMVLRFAALQGSGQSGLVRNIRFRVHSLDHGHRCGPLSVRAFDGQGRQRGPDPAVPLTGDSGAAGRSRLVTIPGPLARIELDYRPSSPSSLGIVIGELRFDAIPASGPADPGRSAPRDGPCIWIAPLARTQAQDGRRQTLPATLDDAAVTKGKRPMAPGTAVAATARTRPAVARTVETAGTQAGPGALICFAAGTRIRTAEGERPIETLRPGDRVVTADHGAQPLRWIGSRRIAAAGNLAPIRIRAGLFNNHRDLLVSPNHRVLYEGYRAQRLFDQHQVLVPAQHLVDHHDILEEPDGEVTYLHLMFDRHEIIFAEGAASESFHPGGLALDALRADARDVLFAAFPDLRALPDSYGPASRMCIEATESRMLDLAC